MNIFELELQIENKYILAMNKIVEQIQMMITEKLITRLSSMRDFEIYIMQPQRRCCAEKVKSEDLGLKLWGEGYKAW